MSGRLAGKSVVITGASSGNGRAIAYEMASRGANLALCARRRTILEHVAHECRQRGGEALAIEADVADGSAITALAQAAVDRFGSIDIWINWAAVLQFGRIDETPVDVLEQVLATNVLGYFMVLRQQPGSSGCRGTGCSSMWDLHSGSRPNDLPAPMLRARRRYWD